MRSSGAVVSRGHHVRWLDRWWQHCAGPWPKDVAVLDAALGMGILELLADVVATQVDGLLTPAVLAHIIRYRLYSPSA